VGNIVNSNMGFGAPGTGSSWQYLGRTATAATIGGTVTAISGGKFGNGAATAAFLHVVNAEVTGGLKKPRSGKNFLNMFDSDDDLWESFNAFTKKMQGMFVVGGHSRKHDSPFMNDNYGARKTYGAAELYQFMLENGYEEGSGVPIILWGCETGKSNTNGESLASQLAILSGAPVAGASETLWAAGQAPPAIAVDSQRPDGSFTRGAAGYVRWFNPQGKEIVPSSYNPYSARSMARPSGQSFFPYSTPAFGTWRVR